MPTKPIEPDPAEMLDLMRRMAKADPPVAGKELARLTAGQLGKWDAIEALPLFRQQVRRLKRKDSPVSPSLRRDLLVWAAEYGDAGRGGTEKKTKRVNVRFTERQYAEIERLAKRDFPNVAALIEYAAVKWAREQLGEPAE